MSRPKAAKAGRGVAVAAVRPRILAALLALLPWAPLRAELQMSTGVNRYSGSDGVSVVSPQMGADMDLDERTKVGLHYTVDAVSGASFNYAQSKTHRDDPRRAVGNCKSCHSGIDAISGASRNYLDTRHDINLSVTRKVGETDIKPAYIRSQENDYLSETLSLGLEQALFTRDTTLSLGLRRMSDQIRPTWNKGDVRELLTHGASLGLTQVLTRSSVLRLGVDLADMQGYLSNPYAYLQVGKLDTLPFAEAQPGQRQRVDLSGRFKQALGWDSSVELAYRWYQDSWDVKAQTMEGVLATGIAGFTLEAGWRHYSQTQAWFFQNFYSAPQAYMSRDLKLAAFSDDLLSLGLRGDLGGGWAAELRYGFLQRQDDLDYRLYFADSAVHAQLGSIGLTYH